MNFIINLFIITLFICPFIVIIHEAGHAFFLKLVGGRITEFSIGNGEVLWKKKNFHIRSAYFVGGRVVTNNLNDLNKKQQALFILGGVIFNFISAFLLDIITGYEIWVFRNYLDSFIFVSYINTVINLIPLTTIIGETDGKKLLELYKNKI